MDVHPSALYVNGVDTFASEVWELPPLPGPPPVAAGAQGAAAAAGSAAPPVGA